MRNSSGRITLQSDWAESLREEGKFWVSYLKPGFPTIHGEVSASELGLHGSAGFSAEQTEPRKITIKYRNDDNYCLMKFQVASVNFSAIHRKSISSLDVSSGGLAVSADSEGKLLIWDADSGEVRRNLEGHVGDVYGCKFFPSGIVVLSGGSDMMIKVWSAETGKCAATFIGHRAPITDFAIVDRGRNVFSSSKDGTVKLWDCGSQQCVLTLADLGLGIINGCALVEAGPGVPLQDPVTNRHERESGTEAKVIGLAGEIGKVATYCVQSRKKILQMQCDSAVNCCSFLDDHQFCYGTQDGRLFFWDMRRGESPIKVLDDRNSAVLSMCSSPQGLLVSSADGSCYCLRNNYMIGVEYTGPDLDPVYGIVDDGKFIYTASRDGTIRKYSS